MQAGTPAFQPPEQIKGELLGPGSDVYALGCIITEIFGNKPVWAGVAPHTIILKVTTGNYPSVAHLPQSIKEITDLCFVEANSRATAATILKELCKLIQ